MTQQIAIFERPANGPVRIDPELCLGCGLCAPVCPLGIIEISGGLARISGQCSLECGHCQAACPEQAVTVASIDPGQSLFSTFSLDPAWNPPGRFDPAPLAGLMGSRRSCRNFTDEPVSPEELDDLVKFGLTAPSGTNSQAWTFTLLPDRKSVLFLGREIAEFFRSLNKLAEKTLVRKLLKLIGKPELEHYHQEYFSAIQNALKLWDEQGKDLLFHGGTAAVVAASRPGASCPMEDVMLAAQNILLGAHAMGLGTCLIGYAVAAMKENRTIQERIGIPKDETVYAVISLGRPKEKYHRIAGRRRPVTRIFKAP